MKGLLSNATMSQLLVSLVGVTQRRNGSCSTIKSIDYDSNRKIMTKLWMDNNNNSTIVVTSLSTLRKQSLLRTSTGVMKFAYYHTISLRQRQHHQKIASIQSIIVQKQCQQQQQQQQWIRSTTSLTSSSKTTPTTQIEESSDLKNVVMSSSSSSSSTTTNNHLHLNSKSTFFSYVRTIGICIVSIGIGFQLGRLYKDNNDDNNEPTKQKQVLPNGLPRTCCDDDKINKNSTVDNSKKKKKTNVVYDNLTKQQKELPAKLLNIVGKDNIIIDGTVYNTTTMPFLKGSRLGLGTALCIVTPEKLQHVIDIVQEACNANCVIIPQGQNTGLTGGSVPRGSTDNDDNDDHRPVIIVSMKKLNRMFPIDDGKRIVCLAGVGLSTLDRFLKQYFPHRESHSNLGSTFLNPTVGAGIAFGSGGTQCCRKGPAYTERVLYIKVITNKWKEKIVTIVNTLGIEHFMDENEDPTYVNYMDDGNDPAICTQYKRRQIDNVPNRIDRWSRLIYNGNERDMRYTSTTSVHGTKVASDMEYTKRLCQLVSSSKSTSTTTSSSDDLKTSSATTTNTVSRYNADTRGPECCRSEGKVIILASVHDTFPRPIRTKSYWIGFDTIETAYQFRTDVCLHNPIDVPISMEYLNKDSFDIINNAGRVLSTIIKYTGTSSSIVRTLWNMKLYIEALPFRGCEQICDTVLYRMNHMLTPILPSSIIEIGTTMDHHVAVTVGDYENHEQDEKNKEETTTTTITERFHQRLYEFQKKYGTNKVKIYECQTIHDTNSISAFRFVAAPAFRTYCIGENKHGFSVDYALPVQSTMVPTLPTTTNDNDNDTDQESTQQQITIQPIKRMRYSHFACNVVHEDIAYEATVPNVVEHIKHQLKHIIETQPYYGKLPAEHGHGTEYIAPIQTQQRWKDMDPFNMFNPGIGGLSKKFKYQ